jgi:hypothetical protein
LVAVRVLTPTKLTKEQRQLLDRLGELIPPPADVEENADKETGFLGRLFGSQ